MKFRAGGKIVIASDVVENYLRHTARTPSVLRRIAGRHLCYMTVVGASELFSRAATKRQRQAVEDALAAMKVLGINARSAKRFGELLRRYPRVPAERLFVGGMCIESGLPLVTLEPRRYAAIRELTVIDAASLAAGRRPQRNTM